MPEITAVHFSIFALLFTVGAALGWIMRGDRSARERIAVNAVWQERVEAQEQEHARLTEQNTKLMDAVSEYQAAQRDTAQRAKELSKSLKEAIARRDELQRQIKDIRGDLEGAMRQRDMLQKTDLKEREPRSDTSTHALRDRDEKIFKLSRELTSWQNRLPPLVNRFRERDREAKELGVLLQQAELRIAEFEARQAEEHTRIEPMGAGALPEGFGASNDQFEDVSDIDLSDLQDQIEVEAPLSAPGLIQGMDGLPGYRDPLPKPGGARTIDPARSTPETAVKDDLQQIKGVGPAIEKTLHDLGIFRFDQIAAITEYDINRIAERLKGFRTRIYREDWIGQARTLQDLRQTDPA